MEASPILLFKSAAQVISLAALLGLEGLYPFFTGRSGRLRHGARNLAFGFANAVLVAVLFSSAAYRVADFARVHRWGLLNAVSLPSWGKILAGIVLFDLWMYLWHSANHRWPLLWRFHRMHHSDTEMDCTTALRFHTGEIMISSVLRLAIMYLLGLELSQVILYECLLAPVILFHHSNVALPEKWDRALRALIVTPHMHRIHHSQIVEETNSNYSSVFSFWDRAMRTFRCRNDLSGLELGLKEFASPAWQTVPGMLKIPFAGASNP